MPFHVGLFKLTKDILAGKLFSAKIFINSFILNAKELAKVQNVLFETLQCLKVLRLSKRYSYLFDIVQSYIKNESRRQMSQNILWKLFTAWKLSVFRSYSSPYFPAFGLNTSIIQSKCGKIRTRITPKRDTFTQCLIFE